VRLDFDSSGATLQQASNNRTMLVGIKQLDKNLFLVGYNKEVN